MPTITAAGRQIYYERHGAVDGSAATPLVLVMGMGGSCRGWLPLQVPDLSAERPVVIFDHRGVAESEDPGGPFTTADLADDTAALLDALGIEQADVLGAFMGGMTAQELALRHPERVSKLVLVGTYGRADRKRRLLLEEWADLAARLDSLQSLMRQRLVWTLHEDTLEQTDLIDAMTGFLERDGVPVTADLFARQCRACIAHDALDRLREVENDTLVVCGQHDILTPPRLHHALADAMPKAHVVTLPAAHMVMMESAERFNQVVAQFLSDGR